MVNEVRLIGNVGNDPELKYLPNNIALARISVATNESYKDSKGDWQTKTEWHTVTMWRQLAERAEKQIKKGQTIYVEAKLTHEKYQKDGKDVYVTNIVAKTFRVLDKKEPSQRQPDQSDYVPEITGGDMGSSYDDLPF